MFSYSVHTKTTTHFRPKAENTISVYGRKRKQADNENFHIFGHKGKQNEVGLRCALNRFSKDRINLFAAWNHTESREENYLELNYVLRNSSQSSFVTVII